VLAHALQCQLWQLPRLARKSLVTANIREHSRGRQRGASRNPGRR
jgi:hypothetical protein